MGLQSASPDWSSPEIQAGRILPECPDELGTDAE